MDYQLCPSILSADFNRLGEQLRILENEGIRYLHIDVMDGDFVPNISFGMPVIKSIRKESKLFFDVHLMVTAPERYIRDFVECGADSITVHVEACEDLERAIEMIRDANVKVGVSLKPATPVNDISHLLDEVDLVLVMTVQPGFGGQKYMEECTEKIRELREIAEQEDLDFDIQVDGGINDETIETVIRAGANLIVGGSCVFNGDLASNVKHLRKRIDQLSREAE
ncbi:MAG: ribulose-phosphate 3-epimerase [Blautia sp.]|nr:ribulose-phosphate 3-epimerase [Blautia sp.]MDY5032804.1 ribulose-phosphate 3-epimerase [Blautia sp.]